MGISLINQLKKMGLNNSSPKEAFKKLRELRGNIWKETNLLDVAKALRKARLDNQSAKKISKRNHTEITFGATTTKGFESFSNMHPSAISCLVNGNFIMFYSAEQAFQYMKTTSVSHRAKIINCIKGKDARYHGSAKAGCPIKSNWDTLKIGVMKNILLAKFSQNLVLAELLISTEAIPIVEIAPWDKERFWGVGVDRVGQNKTGELLQKVRTKLKTSSVSKIVSYYTADLND
jgi:ribA/ribD-fused uncharacterized protein